MCPTMAPRKTQLVIAEDNGAVVKILLKGRSHALRHLHRTHRIAVDWLFDLVKDNNIIAHLVSIKVQPADIFHKGCY